MTPSVWNSKTQLMMADAAATVRSQAAVVGDTETVEAVDWLTQQVEHNLHDRAERTFADVVHRSPNN